MARLWRIIGVLTAMILLASCASAIGTPTPPAPAKTSPSDSKTAATAATPGAAAKPAAAPAKVPQVLTVNIRLAPTQLDPQIESTTAGERALSAVYDRLVVMDSEMKVQPQLATKWEASSDGRTWTFHLRSGVKFHDGTALNAEAVKFNFDRVLNPQTKSQYASDYSMVDSIKVVDDLTVQFQLKYPFAPFVRSLGLPGGMIVSPAAVAKWGNDFGKHGVGAGPFRVEKWVPNERLELARFDEYWRGPAKLERLIFTFITDEQARVSALLSGSTDFEETVPGTLLPLVERNPNIVIERGPAMMTEYIGFNTEKPPFDDARVRRAVGYAIDMGALIKDVMGGIGIHASQPLSPLAFGYDPSLKPYPYDPEKAKQLLAEAGWKDTNGDGIADKDGKPFKTTFAIMAIPQMVKFVEAAQAYLKRVGIDASIQTLDWGAYLAATKAPEPPPIFIIGWGANSGDADTVLWSQFHSSGIPTSNRTRYRNAEVDRLLEEERKELDSDKRLKLLQQAVRIIVTDAPWIPTFVREDLMAHHKKVKGFQHNPSDSYMDFYPIYIGE